MSLPKGESGVKRGFSTEPLGHPVFSHEIEEVGQRKLRKSSAALGENQE